MDDDEDGVVVVGRVRGLVGSLITAVGAAAAAFLTLTHFLHPCCLQLGDAIFLTSHGDGIVMML